MRSDGRVTLGYVARPNGLRGAVVVHCDPSMHPVLVPGLELRLEPRSGPPVSTRIRSAAPVKGGLRVVLDRVSDRNASEALVGATLSVERRGMPGLAEGEYLDTDLVGLDVVADDGRRLGRLTEVIPTGANDVYVVTADDGSEVLVPAVAHALLDIDLEAGRVTVLAAAAEFGQGPPAANPPPGKPAAAARPEGGRRDRSTP